MQKLRYLLIIVAVIASIYGYAVKSFPLFAGCLAAGYLLFLLEYVLRYLGYCKIRRSGERCRAVLVDCTQFEVDYQRRLLYGESYELTVRVGEEQFEVQGAFDKPPCEVGDELDVMCLADAEYVVLPDKTNRNAYFSHILMRCSFVLMACFFVGLIGYFFIHNTFDQYQSRFPETDAMARAQLGLD